MVKGGTITPLQDPNGQNSKTGKKVSNSHDLQSVDIDLHIVIDYSFDQPKA